MAVAFSSSVRRRVGGPGERAHRETSEKTSRTRVSQSQSLSSDHHAEHTRISSHERVRLLVGDQRVVRVAPKSMLCEKSKFFAAALDGRWAEAETREFTIIDHELGTVDACLEWMYTGTIDYGSLTWFEIRWELSFHLTKLYVFADAFDITVLRDLVLDGYLYLMTDHDWLPYALQTSFIFHNTVQGCKLQQFIIDWWTYEGTSGLWRITAAYDIAELANALIKRLLNLRPVGTAQGFPPYMLERCYYHEHNNESRACEASQRQPSAKRSWLVFEQIPFKSSVTATAFEA